jgi:hypothetical protein
VTTIDTEHLTISNYPFISPFIPFPFPFSLFFSPSPYPSSYIPLPLLAAVLPTEAIPPRPLVIPQIPSPFSSAEGVVSWAQILAPPPPEAAQKRSEKLKKGSAEEMEREREHKQGQINTYYRSMYEQVRAE